MVLQTYKGIFEVILVVQIDTKSIILTATTMVTILTLILLNLSIDGFSQTLQTPDFLSNPNIDKSELKDNTQAELATKIQLVPHESEYLDDYYQVSDFAFVLSNSSQLCPSGNCKYELEGGTMQAERISGERLLAGRITIDSGDSKNMMELRASWKTVNEIEKNGENVKVIKGTLDLGTSQFNPENKYHINGTLTKHGEYYLLEVKGIK
ncbi:MAG TPA: hypothetical protein VEW92_00585 [Nitrososphaeraceae archaeon]|nr:hypothetical protein [Nitrososphaeraceae archaeon]